MASANSPYRNDEENRRFYVEHLEAENKSLVAENEKLKAENGRLRNIGSALAKGKPVPVETEREAMLLARHEENLRMIEQIKREMLSTKRTAFIVVALVASVPMISMILRMFSMSL